MRDELLTRRQMVVAGASLPLASAALAAEPYRPTMSASAPVPVQGYVKAGLEAVRAAFQENFTSGQEIGASFAVYRDGVPLVDLWGGSANKERTVPVTNRTLYTLMSTTKGLAAVCIAMLVDRGKLDYEAPVVRYWPQFGAAGKAAITVGQLMSHQAGLVSTRTPVSQEQIFAQKPLADMLAAQKPFFQPGLWGYHGMTFGTLADELVRRVDGRTMSQFFTEEVALKYDLDLFLGLPESEEVRASEMISGLDDETRFYDSPNPEAAAAFANIPSPAVDLSTPAQRQWRASGHSASSGSGNARGLAKFYSIVIGSGSKSEPLLSRSVLQQATRERVCGPDQASGGIGRYAAGFRMNIGTMGSDPSAFGHPGYGGSMGFADTKRRLGIAYTPNHVLNPNWQWVDPRFARLLGALYGVDSL